jgi:hypothetical protein
VFPAGVGGIQKLPTGYVSDQANKLFSPMELDFMHNSIISLDRFLFGPGKRGTLSASLDKASKSNIVVSINDDNELELSFTALGTPYAISQFYRSDKSLRFAIPPDSETDGFDNFIESLKAFTGNYKLIVDSQIPKGHILIGFYDNKYYVSTSNGEITPERIGKEIHFAISNYKIGDLNQYSSHITQHHQFQENENTARVYAKTALNVLAYLMGNDVALQNRFDAIRSWIIGASNTKEYLALPRADTNKHNDMLPEESHWCIIQRVNNDLMAVVCFYNYISRTFRLGKALDNDSCDRLGLICDWKNRKEYTLAEWIMKLCSSSEQPSYF